MACPGSVVQIDRHKVQYKIRGKTMEKECFRRDFVSKLASKDFWMVAGIIWPWMQ